MEAARPNQIWQSDMSRIWAGPERFKFGSMEQALLPPLKMAYYPHTGPVWRTRYG
jgi:hypothetical protein